MRHISFLPIIALVAIVLGVACSGMKIYYKVDCGEIYRGMVYKVRGDIFLREVDTDNIVHLPTERCVFTRIEIK